MSRFVAADEVNDEDLAKQEAHEEKLLSAFEQEKSKEGRRTLAQQLRENRQQKYKEYKDSMEEENSLYKWSQRDMEYYGKLEEERRSKRLKEKADIEREITTYKQAIRARERTENSSIIDELEKIEAMEGRKRRNSTKDRAYRINKRKATARGNNSDRAQLPDSNSDTAGRIPQTRSQKEKSLSHQRSQVSCAPKKPIQSQFGYSSESE
ncbi:hypothetical protein KL918_000227 [Ogataea parapolymorpha]|uniref:FAM192A/Fyv6 N-terminal domain-containing protein n=1 Tax=Ogataea parapolymorpha (strain ATCC 26012 / BCRC 20466 / JCM 22074 / NRRL Y-7560 / DL-1) TaxID=871575 RepID=W1Q8G9_OGAPD|nr:hypothetical protein HPODL_02903 [Ogataea parapolymorpha DL-1]ESW96276.1 hypothetical protein HPODL_02903 [Ogataea parapolymorpha DL-1]KAG7870023.1 hypothetical protein KL918_000227 [Ogataea parapolymorpha]KAG7874972.1 hypothetical protein KL916_000584 [Ogataea parapolymorpha]